MARDITIKTKADCCRTTTCYFSYHQSKFVTYSTDMELASTYDSAYFIFGRFAMDVSCSLLNT